MESPAEPGAASTEQSTLEARIARLEQQVARLDRLLSQSPGAVIPASGQAPQQVVPPPPPSPTLFAAQTLVDPEPTAPAARRETSLEDRLGSQWFNRIGIVLLLLGTSWFLKLAIDRGWIVPSPAARVIFGVLAGAGLVLWSERFRSRGFAPFSYSLKALGSGVLYLSLWAAYRLYGILPGAAALALMIAVTAWNAFMAWAQDTELLAVYALAGAFATPMLLSTGGNHEIFLFTYLLAIDLATVALVRLKTWPRLLLGAFPLTVAYFAVWYVQNFAADALAVTSLYIALFGAVFLTVPLGGGEVANPARKQHLGLQDIGLPLGNAAFVALALYTVLEAAGHQAWQPWMVLLLAGCYLALVRAPQSHTASAIHLSIAVVLLTIAVPLKASGHWIIAGWLVEGLALVWVTTRIRQSEDYVPGVLRWLSVGALALGLSATLLHLFPLVSARNSSLWNSDIATALLGLAIFASVVALARRHFDGSDGMFWSRTTAISVIVFNLLAVLTGVREVAGIWPAAGIPGSDAALKQGLAISGFLMLYGACLLAAGFWRRSAFLRWQGLVLLLFTILKTFLYDMRDLSQGYRVASFLALGALLMAISFAYQRDWLALRPASIDTEPSSAHTGAQP